MPAKLSKFAIEATCKEYLHPWTDSCISAAAGMGLQVARECLKVYSALYLLTLLTKCRIPSLNDLKKTSGNIIRSTAFLTWSGFSGYVLTCSLRKLLGNFNILSVIFIPAFFASLMAILIEKPSRRTLLGLYVSNIATETIFRMAVYRGYVPIVPRGEIFIFAAGMATLLYLFRTNKNNCDSIFTLVRMGLGPFEENSYNDNNQSQSMSSYQKEIPEIIKAKQPKKLFKSNLYIIQKALKVYQQIIDKIKVFGGRHSTCPHPNSCVHNTIAGGLKMFSMGFCVQVGMKLIFQLKNIVKRPKHLKEILCKRENFNLACFLGGFAGLYNLISCSLRRMLNKDSPNYAIVAGLLASTSFAMYPDNTIALYVAWKALQLTWNKGVEIGKVPEVEWFLIFLYCFSTATLFHAAIVEPQHLKLSYWKFLYNFSGGRLAVISRLPLDEFGLESSRHVQDILKKTRTHDKHIYSF